MTALDGALRANLAVFRSEYTDMQINATIFDPGAGTNTGTGSDTEAGGGLGAQRSTGGQRS